MPYVDREAAELNLKIVYWGAGLAGKTTNMMYVFNKTRPEAKSEQCSRSTERGIHTLSFSFIPLSLPRLHGLRVRLHLWTAPGPLLRDPSHAAVLKGADGVIVVADSTPARIDANRHYLDLLHALLRRRGGPLVEPYRVIQYNKRDLPDALPVEELRRHLNQRGDLEFEAVAPEGLGVFNTLRTAVKGVLDTL